MIGSLFSPGTKRDRQPEFTQLDIELSFVDREGVKSLIERLLVHSLSRLKDPHYSIPVPSTPFPSMTYQEAMSSYGVDKPDVRFGMKVIDLTPLLLDGATGSAVIDACVEAGGSVKCIKVENRSKKLTKPEWKEVLTNTPKKLVTEGEESNETEVEEESVEDVNVTDLNPEEENFVLIVVKKDSKWETSSHVRHFHEATRRRINEYLAVKPGDVIILTQGDDAIGRSVALGKLRLKIAKALETKGADIYDGPFAWLWVDDFPLFLPAEDETELAASSSSGSSSSTSLLESAHHPFTAPHPDDVHLLDEDPLRCRGLHYDLVLNGNEIGGGSIRIHDGEFQRKILKEFLKEETDQLEHLLKALDSGAPPHGGIALGELSTFCPRRNKFRRGL